MYPAESPIVGNTSAQRIGKVYTKAIFALLYKIGNIIDIRLAYPSPDRFTVHRQYRVSRRADEFYEIFSILQIGRHYKARRARKNGLLVFCNDIERQRHIFVKGKLLFVATSKRYIKLFGKSFAKIRFSLSFSSPHRAYDGIAGGQVQCDTAFPVDRILERGKII